MLKQYLDDEKILNQIHKFVYFTFDIASFKQIPFQ